MKKLLIIAASLLSATFLFSQNIDMSAFHGMTPRSIGPAGMSGRVTAIEVDLSDTDNIYIGAAAGGIWRSLDGGVNWTLRVDEHLAYPVTDIVHDPGSPNRMYATTGELRGGGPEFPGIGVLRSNDNGNSWFALPIHPSDNFMWLSKVRVNPSNAKIIYTPFWLSVSIPVMFFCKHSNCKIDSSSIF